MSKQCRSWSDLGSSASELGLQFACSQNRVPVEKGLRCQDTAPRDVTLIWNFFFSFQQADTKKAKRLLSLKCSQEATSFLFYLH